MPRYQRGKPPGPGRPVGCRNKSAAILDAIALDGIEDTIRTVKQQADGGNMYAASLLLARAWPRRQTRPVALDLPSVETAAGVVQAQAALVAAMAAGEVTPEEAQQ